jgi:hypothetical protein
MSVVAMASQSLVGLVYSNPYQTLPRSISTRLRWQPIGSMRRTPMARRDTPLYRLKTASQRVAEVLTALAEGLSVAAATRVFGHRHATITTGLTRAGAHSATLHDRSFRALHVPGSVTGRIRCGSGWRSIR